MGDATSLAEHVDRSLDATLFSGVVRVEAPGIDITRFQGLADRRHGVENAPSTTFAIASGVKGFTALTIMSLVDSGELALDAPARSMLRNDLPLIDDRVTVEHLLSHRSGIGDYLDEETLVSIDDYVMPVPVHRLVTTADYLQVLDGHPQVSEPGTHFAYNNGGYVVLALIAERAGGTPFHDLVGQRVLTPAAMAATEFLRSDELPRDTAIGYLHSKGLRSNVLHLPVRGSGDGGIYTTIDDMHRFWRSLFDGSIVSDEHVRLMTTPRSTTDGGRARYGMGFWCAAEGSALWLEGYDAGVSFKSSFDPEIDTLYTVIGNTSAGAWPIAETLDEWFS